MLGALNPAPTNTGLQGGPLGIFGSARIPFGCAAGTAGTPCFNIACASPATATAGTGFPDLNSCRTPQTKRLKFQFFSNLYLSQHFHETFEIWLALITALRIIKCQLLIVCSIITVH